MALNIVNAVRKPFKVQAVEVTTENMLEVAKWCAGVINIDEEPGGQQHIKVQVKRALSERQTKAYPGDWVLSADQGPAGFKVYTPKAFTGTFDILVDHMVETVQRMNDRAAREEKAEQEVFSDI